MTSTTSLKELSKAIVAFMQQPVAPLPDDFIDTIAAYLRRHHKYDNAAADRLQEELGNIFDKHVKGRPASVGAWFGIIRRLLPVLQTPDRILQWFDRCEDSLDDATHDRGMVEEIIAGLMDLITLAEEYQDTVDSDNAKNPLIDRLLFAWMDKFYPAFSAGIPDMENNERMIREALTNFGKKRPKQLFVSLEDYLSRKQYRKATLRFFCNFVQSQPPRLHEIQHSRLFDKLLTCLQYDTSTTVVSAALTALVMLLPHMPGTLVPCLPTLFNIYARVLFWDAERTGVIEAPSISDQNISWEIIAYDPEVEDTAMSQLPDYFTILYGLYPINFMDYIRKPQRYLRHANVSGADEVQIQPTEIRHESEIFRRQHTIHPNFYTLSIESEKTDVARWIKMEAPEVVAECLSLRIDLKTAQLADVDASSEKSPRTKGTNGERNVVSETPVPSSPAFSKIGSWQSNALMRTDSLLSSPSSSNLVKPESKSGQLSHITPGKESSSRIPSSPSQRSHSQSQLQDMIESNTIIKSSLAQSNATINASSMVAGPEGSAAENADPQSAVPNAHSFSGINNQIAHLQRQILLLQNDLSFERYLKQQHMAHIGDLRRKQVTEAATEAETQNLIMMNRNLKARFEEAKKAEMQIRKESEKRRARAQQWEAELGIKLRTLREESKKSGTELAALRKDLESSVEEREKLKKMVCDKEVEELRRKQNMQTVELQATEVDRLRSEVQRLTISERDHQAKELERESAVNTASEAKAQAEVMRMRLAAQEKDLRRTRHLFEDQIATLRSQLSDQQDEFDRKGVTTSVVVEETLAASRAKQAELQKQLSLLNRKYTMLQSSLLDMQSETPKAKPFQRSFTYGPDGTDMDLSGLSISPPTTRPKLGMGKFANVDRLDVSGTPAHSTDLQRSMSATSEAARSAARSQEEYAEPHPGSPVVIGSPSSLPPWEHERSSSRTGVHGRSRKNSRDMLLRDTTAHSPSRKLSTAGSKKEKKTGFKGIRGLY